jgi:hypothetical protein
MILSRHTFLHLFASAIAAPVMPRVAWTQAYPVPTVGMLVPFAPGSGTDLAAHLIGQSLSARLGQQVIVINRPGAGSNVTTGGGRESRYGRLHASRVRPISRDQCNAIIPAEVDGLEYTTPALGFAAGSPYLFAARGWTLHAAQSCSSRNSAGTSALPPTLAANARRSRSVATGHKRHCGARATRSGHATADICKGSFLASEDERRPTPAN